MTALLGGRPPGGGGGVSDHGLLGGLPDDDHDGYARLTGRAGSQTLQGGTAASENLHLESTAHATKGYVRCISNFIMRDGLAFLQNVVAIGQKNAPALGWVGLIMNLGGLNAAPIGSRITGISGKISSSNADASNASQLYGLDFQANAGRATGSPTVSQLVGCLAQFSAIGSGITVTDGAAFRAQRAASLFATFTRAMGVWIPNVGKAIDTDVYGLRVDDQTLGTNKYLAILGPLATPRMRLNAGTPGAGQTQLYLAEGTTPTVRRVQHKDGASIGAGDKVMILV